MSNSSSEIILLMRGNGTITVINEGSSYNSPRKIWISRMISAWDGSVDEFEKMIKEHLNDEGSYNHIETSYLDISSNEDMQEVNKIFRQAGIMTSAQVGDIILVTEFSAKNAFDATIKNTAYGIARYRDRSITLIAIE